MRVKRYRPNFFIGFEDEYAEFTTKDEMLAVPWIAQWKNGQDFVGFFVSAADHYIRDWPDEKQDRSLMAVTRGDLRDGFSWYVVFTTTDPEVKKALVEWLPEIDFSDLRGSVERANAR